jgi:hypothetical protein
MPYCKGGPTQIIQISKLVCHVISNSLSKYTVELINSNDMILNTVSQEGHAHA